MTWRSTRFAPEALRGKPAERQAWAVEQLHLAAKASRRLGLNAHATFSGALAWPYLYPWPQRPAGLVEEAFGELAKRWRPILDAFEEQGVDRRLRNPSGRGSARRRDLRALPGRGGQPSARHHPLRSQPLRAAGARLSGVHRHLSRAHPHVPRQGRGAQSDRAGRASMAASRTGPTAPAASARSATGRSISAASSRS